MEDMTNNFGHMADEGFTTFFIVLLGVALATLAWGVIKIVFKVARNRQKEKRSRNKKMPEKHRSNPWEEQWQKQQMAEGRGNRAITKEEHAMKQKELEDRREMYRLQRKENQWKK